MRSDVRPCVEWNTIDVNRCIVTVEDATEADGRSYGDDEREEPQPDARAAIRIVRDWGQKPAEHRASLLIWTMYGAPMEVVSRLR